VAEELWSNLAAGRAGRPDSVHLADYPSVHEEAVDPGLDEAMVLARDVVELGRRIRTETKTRTRQPLAAAIVHLPERSASIDAVAEIVAEELNVGRVDVVTSTDALGRWRAKPDFKVLGPRLGPRVREVAAALEADDGSLAGRLAEGGTVEVGLPDGTAVAIAPGDVHLGHDARSGLGLASGGGLTVALDLEVTPELRREGIARELIRIVQDARKAAGLEVTDRIALAIETEGEAAEAFDAHRDEIAAETLAVAIEPAGADGFLQETSLDGTPVRVTLRKGG
jgi:isoleucyl-tRNA synthetase